MTGMLVAVALLMPDHTAVRTGLIRESDQLSQNIHREIQESQALIADSLEIIKRIEKKIEESRKYDAIVEKVRKDLERKDKEKNNQKP